MAALTQNCDNLELSTSQKLSDRLMDSLLLEKG